MNQSQDISKLSLIINLLTLFFRYVIFNNLDVHCVTKKSYSLRTGIVGNNSKINKKRKTEGFYQQRILFVQIYDNNTSLLRLQGPYSRS